MEYQRGIMDAITDPDVHTIVLMMASQTGKTTIQTAAFGYYVHQDPAPIMMVLPTKELAQAWSKDRLVPMIRDTPVLRDLIRIDNKRDGQNTIDHKMFPGGHITMSGASSPASLSARPIRILFGDEVDRWPRSAGKEGNPLKLAIKRTTGFPHNKKIILCSTPTIQTESRIEDEYERSDKRRYWVKCPICGEMQKLVFENLKFPDKDPDKAYYLCASENGCVIEDGDKYYMNAHGEWRAEDEFRGIAGFHLSALYSPKMSFAEIVREFLDSQGKPEDIQVFVNTWLAETFAPNHEGEAVEADLLTNRVEDYLDAPRGVLVITMSVDVQDDRLEVEVCGHGKDEESWSIIYQVIHGDPGLKDVWEDVEDIMETRIQHALGFDLPIACVCVDAGGHHTDTVYAWCKKWQRKGRRVYAVRGASQAWRPVIGKASIEKTYKCKMFFVGTDSAKDIIFSRLKIENPGSGYCHFPAHYPEDYFDGLTSEKRVKGYKNGRPIKRYVKKTDSARNEPLDLRVYNLAALRILKPNFKALQLRQDKLLERMTPPPAEEGQASTMDAKPQPTQKKRRHGGFVKRW